jgi:hypothetical protein
VKEAVLNRDFIYETGPGRPYKPVVRNVRLENIRSASDVNSIATACGAATKTSALNQLLTPNVSSKTWALPSCAPSPQPSPSGRGGQQLTDARRAGPSFRHRGMRRRC